VETVDGEVIDVFEAVPETEEIDIIDAELSSTTGSVD